MEDIPQQRPVRRGRKLLLYLVLAFLSVPIIATLFIEFNTATTANITDQILRPLIGDAQVTYMEGIFFNASDRINQIRYSIEKPKNPSLVTNLSSVPLSYEAIRASNLNLENVPTDASSSMDGEGRWQNIPLTAFPNQIVVAQTFVRPDSSRPYAFVTLLAMDMTKLQLWNIAGTAQRNLVTKRFGRGAVPDSVQRNGSLVAAFEGGFLFRDGHYGMIVGTTTYEPLKNGLATIVGHKDGRIQILKYEGQSLGKDVTFVRQNASMLIEDNVIKAQDDSTTSMKLWGRVRSSEYYTWRSGVGVTQKGNLVYAAGNSLIPSTLASALKAAGAVNAMQLDINPNWVRYSIFNNFTNGTYTSAPIMQGMPDGSIAFLHGYGRDFFYVVKK